MVRGPTWERGGWSREEGFILARLVGGCLVRLVVWVVVWVVVCCDVVMWI